MAHGDGKDISLWTDKQGTKSRLFEIANLPGLNHSDARVDSIVDENGMWDTQPLQAMRTGVLLNIFNKTQYVFVSKDF